MTGLRWALALSVGSGVLTVASGTFAYCLTRTCDPKAEHCDLADGCNMSGNVLFWASNVVSFDVQRDGSSKTLPDGSRLQLISAEALDAVVTSAFRTWVNADCGNGTHPSISLKDLGPVACAKPEYNSNGPNANVITFHDDAWPYSNSSIDTLALTTVYFDPETGQIYDANVEINSNQESFAVGTPVGDQFALSAVLTHELGHFLGLSHTSARDATMFSNYQSGMDTLEADDEAAICASLPPTRTVAIADSGYLPRHGWSSECGSPSKGCCATAVGSAPDRNQTLGLWGFVLGLCTWRGRALARARVSRRAGARGLQR